MEIKFRATKGFNLSKLYLSQSFQLRGHMPKLPNIKGKQLLKILQGIGYDLDHIQGSHHILRRSDGKKTTIPIHGNKEIPRGTLLGILSDLDISKEEFITLLKKKK